jgi:hypothetical protein
MSIGLNTGTNYPFAQGNFDITLSSTDIIRKALLGRNLDGSYLNRGNPIPPNGDQIPGSVVYGYLSDYSVVDAPLPEQVTDQDGIPIKTVQFLSNRFGPEDGYGDPLSVDVLKLVNAAQLQYVSSPSLNPNGFVASDYTAIEILNSVQTNPVTGALITGNGKILDDSILIKSSIPYLRDNLGYRDAQYLYDISEKGAADFNITTQPTKNMPEKSGFLDRVDGQYVPESSIPGLYFDSVNPPNINGIQTDQILETSSLLVATQLLNGIFNALTDSNPMPNTLLSNPAPSDTLLNYMGIEQQSSIFTALNYNIYRPDYTRTVIQPGGVDAPLAHYYVGSKDNSVSDMQSPMEATPTDMFGKQVKAIVYGPSEMYKEFDNAEGRALWRYYRMGSLGEATIDGGSLEGGFTWVGSTYIESSDASASFFFNQSKTLPLKKGTLLAKTQRLIESAPQYGASRFKHAGHAINQTSKMFNDGYRIISKGSAVLKPSASILGGIVSADEFCRVWAKDKPFSRYKDLQKTGGNQWGDSNSVLDSTFNLNIAPTDPNKGRSTSLGETNVKKYMFSIENLAWRGTAQQSNLPLAEKGPNGGRIMWFPPYELNVSDTNSADWQGTNFLGRPEPIYTYNNSQRVGTLSWTIVVDHPSILNAIAQKELKGMTNNQADKILESFFAGCKKYDISELAETYPNMPLDTLMTVQNNVQGNSTEVTDEFYSDPDLTVTNNSMTINAWGNDGVDADEAQAAEDQQEQESENAALNISNNQEGDPTGGTTPLSSEGDNSNGNGLNGLLQSLLNEADYFQYLEEDSPFLYQSIKDKIKYFHPSFHSMTPEGLNSRLTFLNQCLRPGETIPTVTDQGTRIVDADNTAFGPPPVCVLRIGDFYHSKVIFDSISFSYDPLLLDINPEGVGVQPMIVKVQTNFKFIGGQGLEGPVSQLQNALSFSYFANTEMYDPRSKVTPREVDGGAGESAAAIADNGDSNFQQTEGSSTQGVGESGSGGEINAIGNPGVDANEGG